MRTFSASSILALPFALITAACLPSGPYTVVANPEPEPLPPPPPARVAPLEITVVRPDGGRLLLQTNRYAYVALFEIVPQRGVALIYPASTHQSTAQLSGLSWVQTWWTLRTPTEDRRYSTASNATERYVYALASDRPLRITDAAYDPNYLRRVLGPTAYDASNPYATVRALARYFVPPMADERWGEDLYAMPASYSRQTRVARVYCPDGTVFEVREDMANRAWCPPTPRGRVASGPPRGGSTQPSSPAPSAPDSVLGASGGRVTRRQFDAHESTPVFRVPAESPNDPPPPDRRGTNDPRGGNDPKGSTDPKGSNDPQDRHDNGRRAHGDPANADPRGRGNGWGNGGRNGTAQNPDDVSQQAKPLQGGNDQKPARVDSASTAPKAKPVDPTPRLTQDSSGRAATPSQPKVEQKEPTQKEPTKQERKETLNQVLERFRKTGSATPKSDTASTAKPDSSSTQAPPKKP